MTIKAQLEKYYETVINHGQRYPNLHTLVDKGLIKKAKADDRTNGLSLTRRGQRGIEARRE